MLPGKDGMVLSWWKRIKAHRNLDKVSGDLLRAIYAAIVEKLLASNMQPSEINEWLKDIGKRAGEWLFLVYSRKIGIHAFETDIEKITENICFAIDIFSGAKARYKRVSKNKITIEVKNCAFCRDVSPSDEIQSVKYCEVMAGMIEGAYEMRNVIARATEKKCALNDEICLIEVQVLKKNETLP